MGPTQAALSASFGPMKKPPDMDSLVTVRALQGFSGVLTDEQSVRRILERAAAHPEGEIMQRQIASSVTLARFASVAILYAVDHYALVDALTGDGGPLELPPLPFPRIVFESDEPHPWTVKNEQGDTLMRIEAVAIEEQVEGARWHGALFYQLPGVALNGDEERLSVLHAAEFVLTPSSIEWRGENERRGREDTVRRAIVEAVHYIVAKGVTLTAVKASRQVRRANERKGLFMPEQVYWVRVSDEHIHAPTPGDGTREYHCRWLVRGHWRRIEQARRVWVRPYIKGPAGAPWRGRPIYHVTA